MYLSLSPFVIHLSTFTKLCSSQVSRITKRRYFHTAPLLIFIISGKVYELFSSETFSPKKDCRVFCCVNNERRKVSKVENKTFKATKWPRKRENKSFLINRKLNFLQYFSSLILQCMTFFSDKVHYTELLSSGIKRQQVPGGVRSFRLDSGVVLNSWL